MCLAFSLPLLLLDLKSLSKCLSVFFSTDLFGFPNAHAHNVNIKQCNRSIYMSSCVNIDFAWKRINKKKSCSVASWKTWQTCPPFLQKLHCQVVPHSTGTHVWGQSTELGPCSGTEEMQRSVPKPTWCLSGSFSFCYSCSLSMQDLSCASDTVSFPLYKKVWLIWV